MDKKNTAMGVFWSFLSALLWSSVYVAGRYLMAGKTPRIDPVTLSFIRFFSAGIILFFICLATDRKTLLGLGVKAMLKIALLSLFALTGMSIGLFWGPRYTSATNASMIMSLSPIMIMLLGTFIGERLSWNKILGICIASVGCALVIRMITLEGFVYEGNKILGDLIVAGASLSWAVGAILAKKILTPGNDLVVTSWSMLFSSFTLLLIMGCCHQEIIIPNTKAAWLVVGYIIIFPTTLGFCAWNLALSRVTLNVVSTMQYLTPVLTMLLAYWLLNEGLSCLQALGAIISLSGVVFATRGKSNH